MVVCFRVPFEDNTILFIHPKNKIINSFSQKESQAYVYVCTNENIWSHHQTLENSGENPESELMVIYFIIYNFILTVFLIRSGYL